MQLLGDVLAFTPKRTGRPFLAGKSMATIEGGKWVGAAEAAFAGVVVGANQDLEQKPRLLNEDAFGAGWMVIIEPSEDNWREMLMTGSEIGSAFEAWIKAEDYKSKLE
jgi:glycine cleavage system H protein